MSIKTWFFRLAARYYLKKPEQAEFIETRYGSLNGMFKQVINQVCYILHLDIAPYITSIQFEVTNMCNLKCKMCPVNYTMTRKKTKMDFGLFKKIVDQNKGVEYYLMFNWGEPLLHPQIFGMLGCLKQKKKKVFITTNATLLDTEEKMKKLLTAGLTRLTISMDGFDKTYEKVRGFKYGIIRQRVLKMVELRNEMKSSTRIDLNMVVFKETESEVKRFYQEWRPIVDRLQIQPIIDFSTDKDVKRPRCKEFYRGNVVVLADGRVTICCGDFDAKLVIGDANTTPLKKIWNGTKVRKLRKLQNKGIFPAICRNCNEYKTKLVNPRFE